MTTATGNDDNDVDGDGAMGNEVDDDGNGATKSTMVTARRATTMTTTTMATAMARWAAA